MNKSNIVLMGFMGCGKSTIGKLISQKIQSEFVDTDFLIEKKIGISISSFFEKYGENSFRQIEEEIISEIAQGKNQVIATGGGIIKNFNNISNLRANGIIVYLNASPSHIFQNLKGDTTRPLLNTKDKLETINALLNERKPLYERYADIIVNVNHQLIQDIVTTILRHIGEDKYEKNSCDSWT
ncbi:MAG: shikimate kinase [Epulopiscium sp.]|nr:shikimate kinase [Candidatus Epulonipiscium sp.]